MTTGKISHIIGFSLAIAIAVFSMSAAKADAPCVQCVKPAYCVHPHKKVHRHRHHRYNRCNNTCHFNVYCDNGCGCSYTCCYRHHRPFKPPSCTYDYQWIDGPSYCW